MQRERAKIRWSVPPLWLSLSRTEARGYRHLSNASMYNRASYLTGRMVTGTESKLGPSHQQMHMKKEWVADEDDLIKLVHQFLQRKLQPHNCPTSFIFHRQWKLVTICFIVGCAICVIVNFHRQRILSTSLIAKYCGLAPATVPMFLEEAFFDKDVLDMFNYCIWSQGDHIWQLNSQLHIRQTDRVLHFSYWQCESQNFVRDQIATCWF